MKYSVHAAYMYLLQHLQINNHNYSRESGARFVVAILPDWIEQRSDSLFYYILIHTGVFSWITINYLLGHFEPETHHDSTGLYRMW